MPHCLRFFDPTGQAVVIVPLDIAANSGISIAMSQKVPVASRLTQLARSCRTWEIRSAQAFQRRSLHLKLSPWQRSVFWPRARAGQTAARDHTSLACRRGEIERYQNADAGLELGAGSDKERAPTEPTPLPAARIVEDVLTRIVDDVATPKRLHRRRSAPAAPAKWLHRCRSRPCQTWREHYGDR